jgi:hypothetical protein
LNMRNLMSYFSEGRIKTSPSEPTPKCGG